MEGDSMRPLLIVAAVLIAAAPALAQSAEEHKADAPKAACHAADGKAAPCPRKPARPAKAKISTPMITNCRDVISHQPAKCGGPNAEPVPAN
jgi:hypothetical protein